MISLQNGGATASYASGSNYPLRGQKDTLWEGGTRVPAFLHSPLLQAPGGVYDGYNATHKLKTLLRF